MSLGLKIVFSTRSFRFVLNCLSVVENPPGFCNQIYFILETQEFQELNVNKIIRCRMALQTSNCIQSKKCTKHGKYCVLFFIRKMENLSSSDVFYWQIDIFYFKLPKPHQTTKFEESLKTILYIGQIKKQIVEVVKVVTVIFAKKKTFSVSQKIFEHFFAIKTFIFL